MGHIAKLFMNGRSQAVRLPAAYRFKEDEVYIRQDPVSGDVILSAEPSVYLLDTNTVGYLVRNLPTVLARLVSQPPAMIHISAITEGELWFGLANNPSATRLHKTVSEFIWRTAVLPWDRGVALHYGFLRPEMNKQGKPLAPLNMLIAAHARSVKAILVSSDAAFQMLPDLQVEDWTIPTGHPPRSS